MQAQDATTVYFLKLWAKLEANKKKLIAGAVIIVLAAFLIWFLSAQREQKEVAAGQALTALDLSANPQAEAYLKIASDYPDTMAGQRATLQGAMMLFADKKFADAQIQFQNFLDNHPESEFYGKASLGVAVCLDAQGKTDLAAAAYQRVVNNSSDAAAVGTAKLALAGIYEAQGKNNEAFNFYQDVMRLNPNNALGQEAMWHAMQLKNKLPATSTTAPAATSLSIGQ